MRARVKREYTLGEEIANSVTHGVGLLLSVVALPVLIVSAEARSPGHVSQIVGVCIFAATLMAMYTTSTVYHALPPSKGKRVFRVLDHSAIYLLIAGTYTPFALGALRGPWGWTLFTILWTLAAFGIVFKSTLGMRFPKASTTIYVLMGWMAVIVIKPFVANVPLPGLLWLLAGGIFYTGGVVFFVWERLRYGHALWHLCVLGGSVCHFVAVLYYSAGAPR
jgi:hemolysin III